MSDATNNRFYRENPALLRSKTLSDATLSFQFWLIVVPGTVIAGAILAAASFVVAPPFGW